MSSSVPEIEPSVSTLHQIRIAGAIPGSVRQFQWRLFTLILVLLDGILAIVAFRLAYLIRFELAVPIFYLDVAPSQPFYQTLAGVLIVVWIVLFFVLGLYDRRNLLGGTKEYALVYRGSTFCLFIVMITAFVLPALAIARGWLFLSWIFAFVLISFGRFATRRIIYFLRRYGLFLSPAVIVGANQEGLSLARQFVWTTSGFHVLGFVDEKLPTGTLVGQRWSILGSVAQLEKVVNQFQIEEVILASSAISSREKLLEIFRRYGLSRDVNVRLSSGLYEIITTGLSVHEFASVPLVRVNKVRLTGGNVALKLLLDYAVTVPVVVMIAPLLLLVALIIKLDSPGPILYRRRVMGVNGRQFDAYKFRTMHLNGDALLAARPDLQAELARHHKLKDDPRITRVGRLLRRTSVDELPQLFNVLKAEMSLVGPRMISPPEMEKYDQWGLNLLTVKPGITGLWQVSGRSNISYEERVQMDMHYVRNWSLWLDLQLLWQTFPAVIQGIGAY